MTGFRRRLLFREVNERIADVSAGLELELPAYELFCECHAPDCVERVRVPAHAFDAARHSPDRFVVAPGHAGSPRDERIVRDEPPYVVVSSTEHLTSPVLSAAPSAA